MRSTMVHSASDSGLTLPTRFRLVETECRVSKFRHTPRGNANVAKFARLTLPWRNYGRQNRPWRSPDGANLDPSPPATAQLAIPPRTPTAPRSPA